VSGSEKEVETDSGSPRGRRARGGVGGHIGAPHVNDWRAPEPYLKLAVLVAAALVPLVVPSFQTIDLVLKIAIFATLVASYDILLGYTGIVSFGHAMFFGFGGYAMALAVGKSGGYGRIALGIVAGVVVSLIVSLLVSAFSLRVKAIFFAMITLAFAEFALILAVQLSQLTGGEDGLSPAFSGVFAPSWSARFFGVPLTGRLTTYYTVLALCAALFFLMSRFVSSPLGRTLQAIRDNELRAEALGIRTFVFQSISSSFASVVATLLGAAYVLWVRYVNPESALGIPIMLDILLMVIIGGIGTLWGGVIGAAVLLTAQTLLPKLRAVGAALFAGSVVVERLTDRWLLWFGVLFVLVVFFFPRGVLGTIRERRRAS
jgi:branched-chain amino acid transport system permease protein